MDTNLKLGALILCILALVAAATAFASDALQSPAVGIDDANIFFVYARNVSAGDGFVFNRSGERVEGFSSLLWVLVCSGAIAAARNPERLLLALNVMFVSLTIVCCVRSSLFRRVNDENGAALMWASAFVLIVLLDSRYVVWNTITLMETALWGALITLAALLVIEDRVPRHHAWGLAALVALMIMMRPEAFVWAPAVCGLFYVKHAAIEGRARASAAVLPSVVAYVATAGALTVFRLAYFGVPLPNTYYAKVPPSLAFSLGEGAKYFAAYLSSGPIPFACFLALIGSVAHLLNTRFRDHRTLALTVLGLMGLGIPVLIGGDHFDGFRFYQSAFPILVLALLNFLRFIVPQYLPVRSARPFRRTVMLVGIASIVALTVSVQIVESVQFGIRALQTEFDIAAAGRRMGRELNVLFEELHPLPDIGSITVGGLKYTYEGHVVDMMGLNNTKMAHNEGDRIGYRGHAAFETHTFYELKPSVIVPLVQHSDGLTAAGERVLFVDLVLKGLLQEKRFHEAYRLAEVRKTTPVGVVSLAAWYDREFLSKLAHSGKFQIVVQGMPGQD